MPDAPIAKQYSLEIKLRKPFTGQQVVDALRAAKDKINDDSVDDFFLDSVEFRMDAIAYGYFEVGYTSESLSCNVCIDEPLELSRKYNRLTVRHNVWNGANIQKLVEHEEIYQMNLRIITLRLEHTLQNI